MSDLSEIIELERSVWKAVIDQNAEFLSSVFAHDYCEITVDGQRIRQEEIVEQSPLVDQIESYTMSQAIVQAIAEGGAVLSYHLRLSGRLRGRPIQPEERWVMSVWGRRDEGWQCLAFQQTAVNPSG